MSDYPLTIVVRTPERFVVCQQSERHPYCYLMVPNLSYEHHADAERGRQAHEAVITKQRTEPVQ